MNPMKLKLREICAILFLWALGSLLHCLHFQGAGGDGNDEPHLFDVMWEFINTLSYLKSVGCFYSVNYSLLF